MQHKKTPCALSLPLISLRTVALGIDAARGAAMTDRYSLGYRSYSERSDDSDGARQSRAGRARSSLLLLLAGAAGAPAAAAAAGAAAAAAACATAIPRQSRRPAAARWRQI